jgi:hypothetical protein
MIEFTSTLLKSVGDPKPARNPAGAGAGVTFHPQVWPRAGAVDVDHLHITG